MIAFRFVIVDDDPDDRELLRESFEAAGLEPVLTLASATSLLEYLQNVEREEDLPLLIITDVNMPGMSGLELLAQLKLTPRFSSLPVVVWSTSNNTTDMNRAVHLGAASYVVKPALLREYEALLPRLVRHAQSL